MGAAAGGGRACNGGHLGCDLPRYYVASVELVGMEALWSIALEVGLPHCLVLPYRGYSIFCHRGPPLLGVETGCLIKTSRRLFAGCVPAGYCG